MFTKSARFYDAVYSGKDYAREGVTVREFIRTHKRSAGMALLDVACGTGAHLAHLRQDFDCEGLDLDEKLLEIAAERLPGIPLHQASMIDFRLGKPFDVITCLFSAIGYVKTIENLFAAVQTMAGHLAPGGVLLLEPWFTPDQWRPGGLHALYRDEPDLKITRMNISGVKGNLSIIDFHYLVGTPDGIEHFTELHELGLFTVAEYGTAFERAQLTLYFDAEGLMGRGLYIGCKPI